MDYGEGTVLRKYQWDLIHNPESNFTLFDSDGEGESSIAIGATLLSQIMYANGSTIKAYCRDCNEGSIGQPGVFQINNKILKCIFGEYSNGSVIDLHYEDFFDDNGNVIISSNALEYEGGFIQPIPGENDFVLQFTDDGLSEPSLVTCSAIECAFDEDDFCINDAQFSDFEYFIDLDLQKCIPVDGNFFVINNGISSYSANGDVQNTTSSNVDELRQKLANQQFSNNFAILIDYSQGTPTVELYVKYGELIPHSIYENAPFHDEIVAKIQETLQNKLTTISSVEDIVFVNSPDLDMGDDGHLRTKEANYVQWAYFAVEELVHVTKKGEINKELWNDTEAAYNEKIANIYAPVAGVPDELLMEFKDLLDMLELCGQVCEDPIGIVTQLYEGIANLEVEQVKKMVSEAVSTEIETLTTPGTERQYKLSRYGTRASIVIFAFTREGLQLTLDFTELSNGFTERITTFVGKLSDGAGLKFQKLSEDLKKKFLEDFENASQEVFDFFNDLPGGVDAWEIAFRHGDDLRTDVPFLTKLLDDITNPQFPTGSPATASQVKTALGNPDIFNFYKKFFDGEALSEAMRSRYLEAIILNDFLAIRKPILENILTYKKTLLNQISNLSLDEKLRIKRGNMAYGTINIVGESPINVLSLSGNFNQALVSKIQMIYPNKVVVPKINGGTNSNLRYFTASSNRLQDAELKVLEYSLERLRIKYDLNLGNAQIAVVSAVGMVVVSKTTTQYFCRLQRRLPHNFQIKAPNLIVQGHRTIGDKQQVL